MSTDIEANADHEDELSGVLPRIAEAFRAVHIAYEEAGLQVPTGEMRLQMPHAPHHTPNQIDAKCVEVCIWVCVDGYCGWFCYFDCTGGKGGPRVLDVTCKYGGVEYSEGAVINNGGVKQRCVNSANEG